MDPKSLTCVITVPQGGKITIFKTIIQENSGNKISKSVHLKFMPESRIFPNKYVKIQIPGDSR